MRQRNERRIDGADLDVNQRAFRDRTVVKASMLHQWRIGNPVTGIAGRPLNAAP